MTFMGMTGTIWCLLAAICYGMLNIFAKLGFERGLLVSRLVVYRHGLTMVMAYLFGKLVRDIDFDLRKHDRKAIGATFLRSSLVMISKLMQYAAISYIPLSISSTISFTAGPIFGALIGFIMIRENLSL